MEASSTPNPKLKISFKGQNHEEMQFSVKPSAKVMRLMKIYCAENQLEYSAAVFLHDGHLLQRKGTVEEAGIKDGDQIDVMVHCDGGGPQINA